MRNTEKINKIIIKVGSSSLCNEKGKIEKLKILNLTKQIAKLKEQGKDVILVSSGAIASGMGALNLKSKPTTIPEKQALAAIGQARLMQIYEEIFELYDLKCSQILLNHEDFDSRKRLMNFSNTMNALMNYGVIPIVNENDALAVDEIKVGDNDTLSALLVPVIDADLLVLVSDIDGLYTSNPNTNPDAILLKEVEKVDDHIIQMAGGSSSNLGTGGMATKIKAAKMVNDFGCHMVIVNGQKEDSILHIFDEKESGTWFKASDKLNARKHWLTYRSKPKGKLVVDEGASKAILKRRSLLPSGIQEVEGNFLIGQVVDLVNLQNETIARGIVNYSSDEIRLIKGVSSKEIEDILHYKDYDEVIHANNMVLVK